MQRQCFSLILVVICCILNSLLTQPGSHGAIDDALIKEAVATKEMEIARLKSENEKLSSLEEELLGG